MTQFRCDETKRTKVFGVKTTKICPNCGDDKMISLGSLDEKYCPSCPTIVAWTLDSGQKRTFNGVRGNDSVKQ